MISNNHKVAYLEIRIHTAGSIRYKQGLNTQLVHHTHGERHILHRVALIEMETALHGHYIHTTQFTKYQLARVSLNGRHWEIRDFLIRELVSIGYF